MNHVTDIRRGQVESLRRRLAAAEAESDALDRRLQGLAGEDALTTKEREILRELALRTEQVEFRLRSLMVDAEVRLEEAEEWDAQGQAVEVKEAGAA